MTYDEFIASRTDKPVDFDGIYPNQCMDLMHQYVYDVLGLTDKSLLAAPAAYQVFTNFKPAWSQYFEKIDNTPTNVPTKGDIVFFGQSIGEWGHVCIFLDGDTTSFRSFDANWPTGTLPHIQKHDYKGVLGWLTSKYNTTDPLKELQGRFDDLMDQFVILKDKYDRMSASSEKELAKLATEIGQKNTQIDKLQESNSNLTSQLIVMGDQVKSAINEKAEETKKIAPLQDTIKALEKSIEEKDSKILELTQKLETAIDNTSLISIIVAKAKKALHIK